MNTLDMSEPVVVASVWSDNEASVIKSLLGSYNIPCHYSADLPTRLYPVSADGLTGHIRIFVPASAAPEARLILEEHRRHQGSIKPVED